MITGANGTVGCDLVEQFSKTDYVYAFFRSPNSFSETFKRPNLLWIQQDLGDKNTETIAPDCIIHAAVTHPFGRKTAYTDYVTSNITALINVIDFALEVGIKHFFFLSSVTIYGHVLTNVLNDGHAYTDPDLLGATKLLSEKLLQDQSFNSYSLRLPGVFCYNTPSSQRPWLNSIISNLRSHNKIVVHNKLSRFNNIIDTIEVFRLIQFLINKSSKRVRPFNFSAREPIVIQDMIFRIRDYFRSRSEILFSSQETPNFVISCQTLSEEFQFQTETTEIIIDRYLGAKQI